LGEPFKTATSSSCKKDIAFQSPDKTSCLSAYQRVILEKLWLSKFRATRLSVTPQLQIQTTDLNSKSILAAIS
jgi:hypothetical protein